jgi:hypothetical protein
MAMTAFRTSAKKEVETKYDKKVTNTGQVKMAREMYDHSTFFLFFQ